MSRIRKIYDPQTNDSRLPFCLHHLEAICDYFAINTDTLHSCDLQTLAHCTILLITCLIGNRIFEILPRIQQPKSYSHGLRFVDVELIDKFTTGANLPPFFSPCKDHRTGQEQKIQGSH
eukprot:604674_1